MGPFWGRKWEKIIMGLDKKASSRQNLMVFMGLLM